MNERRFVVESETGGKIAEHMRLEDALLLVEALFNKYYLEPRGFVVKPEAFVEDDE